MMRMTCLKTRFTLIGLIVGLTAILAAPAFGAADEDGGTSFVDLVDMDAFGRIAVFTDGRLKSFDSHASTMMQFVTGPHRIVGQSPGYTYLDLMFRPGAYRDVALIYVKKKNIRVQLAMAMRESATGAAMPDLEQRLERFIDTGLVVKRLMLDPAVEAMRARLSQDLMRTAKPMNAIDTALAVTNPRILQTSLRMVPPADGSDQSPWVSVDRVLNDDAIAVYRDRAPLVREVANQWLMLGDAWKAGDAAAVNASVVRLGEVLPQLAADLYPDQTRLGWESWYFKSYNMTWVWLIYIFSVVFLVMAVVYRWAPARLIGLLIFLIAFGFHTFALGLRWYVSGRWPNSNMFEAVTTAAWFGGCLAVFMELLARRTPMRGLFALGSAVASMTALMAAYYLPLQLNPGISNMMPVLHDVWLYIHTNVIIFSYCLIFMAAVVAAAYLGYRLIGGDRGFARVGGAGSLLSVRPDGTSYLAANRTSAGVVMDGAVMVLMELSFILLWAGLVMGAIWADHSWGRPWGWDPKEVFALNTFIVFAVLVHVRMKVRDKGLWTALLALFGAITMLFNWIFINFYISGLHSYA